MTIVERTIATLRLLVDLVEGGLEVPISVEFWVGPRVHVRDHPACLDPWLAALGLPPPVWRPHGDGSDLLMAEWHITDDLPFHLVTLRPSATQAAIEAEASRITP